jgi:hypothetical protein
MALMDQAPVAELQKNIVTDDQYMLTRTVHDGWKNITSEELLIDGYQTLSDILDWLETDPKPSQQTFMEDLQDSGFTAFSEETGQQLEGPYYRWFTDDGQYWDDEDGTVTALFDSNWKKGETADEDDLEEMEKMTFHTRPLELTVENVLAYARYVFDDQSVKLIPAQEHLAEKMQEYGYSEEDGTVSYRCRFTPIMKAAAPAGLFRIGLEAALWVWGQAEDEEEPTWHRFRDIYTGDEAHYDAIEYLLDVPEQMWKSPTQRIGISQMITSDLPIQGALAAAELERRYGLPEDSVKPLSQDELDREIVLSRRMETR